MGQLRVVDLQGKTKGVAIGIVRQRAAGRLAPRYNQQTHDLVTRYETRLIRDPECRRRGRHGRSLSRA